MSRQLHELFLASCGIFDRWGLTIAPTEGVVEERMFSTPYAFIGSRPGSCLRLEDPGVSQRHVYFQVVPGGLFCIDLGSRAGIHWDDVTRQCGWLSPGQQLRVGPFAVSLLAPEQEGWLVPSRWAHASPLTDRISSTGQLPPFIVEVGEDGKTVAKGKMNRVLALVGRSPDCLFHIESPSLSKLHCSLVRTPGGMWVVDLMSRTGTFLNGRSVRCGRVKAGDHVQVGKYSLQFRRPRRGAKVSAEVVGGSPDLRKPEEAPSTMAVQPYSDQAAHPAPSVSQPSMAVEPASPAHVERAAVTRRAPPTMLALPQERLGPEWSMLIALVNQFSLMQQQMFDQFQENMHMATRMFSAMQKDQAALVREELDQLRALTGELCTLQGQLATRPATGGSPSAAHAASRNGAPAKNTATPAPAKAPGNGAGQRLAGSSPTISGHAVPAGNAQPSEAGAADGAPLPQTPEQLHAWLNTRISALQDERQTRWNKLLGMILGT
jgi:pSer/pThr/pTyr-binding forkhead associated (FHA) protein